MRKDGRPPHRLYHNRRPREPGDNERLERERAGAGAAPHEPPPDSEEEFRPPPKRRGRRKKGEIEVPMDEANATGVARSAGG